MRKVNLNKIIYLFTDLIGFKLKLNISSIQRLFFHLFFRYFIQICLFITYFGASSVYAVIISKNFQQVIEYYTEETINERLLIASLLLPKIFLCCIPDLKYLAPVSMVANVLMGTSLGITFYYLVLNLHPISEIPLTAPVENFPSYFSITIFAMEAIGKKQSI